MTGLIYGIYHKDTGRWYIGQTIHTLDHRIKEHLNCAEHGVRLHLYNAIRKYGWNRFEVHVLEANIPEAELDRKEIFYIDKYDAYRHGFNNTVGGGGVRGYKHTEATRARIGQSVKAGSYRWNTPERAAKIKAAQKGRVLTQEHRQKLSKSRQGKYTGVDNPFYQKHHTQRTKDIISEANHKHAVEQLDKSTGVRLAVFPDLHAAVKYILSSGKTTAKYTSVYDRIRIACYRAQGTQSAYGFVWNFIDKSVTTNSKAEDELPLEVLNNSD